MPLPSFRPLVSIWLINLIPHLLGAAFCISTRAHHLCMPPPTYAPIGLPRDAVMLACSFKAAAAAYPQSKWPRKVRVRRSGIVIEPVGGSFDVTVAPGEDVQAAVDRCPRGGSVLLLPGTHAGPLSLQAGQIVHVFGRGQAALHAVGGNFLSSKAAQSTCDGLLLRWDPRSLGSYADCNCVYIAGGGLRLQACDIRNDKEILPSL